MCFILLNLLKSSIWWQTISFKNDDYLSLFHDYSRTEYVFFVIFLKNKLKESSKFAAIVWSKQS